MFYFLACGDGASQAAKTVSFFLAAVNLVRESVQQPVKYYPDSLGRRALSGQLRRIGTYGRRQPHMLDECPAPIDVRYHVGGQSR